MKRHSRHVENIALVARRLRKLTSSVVFTGGSVVGLMLTDSGAPDVRPTDDVDIVVGITSYADYTRLQTELRKLGFNHDMNGPNCRFILEGLKVDVMPTDGKILGFTNRWYQLAFESAQPYTLPDGSVVRLISPAVFLATKLEAFEDRGKADYALSHDLEDIITLIDGRPQLAEEVASGESALRTYISSRFAALLTDSAFMEAIAMHLLPDSASQARAKIVRERMRALAEIR